MCDTYILDQFTFHQVSSNRFTCQLSINNCVKQGMEISLCQKTTTGQKNYVRNYLIYDRVLAT